VLHTQLVTQTNNCSSQLVISDELTVWRVDRYPLTVCHYGRAPCQLRASVHCSPSAAFLLATII